MVKRKGKVIGIEFKKRGKWYKQDVSILKTWKHDAISIAKNNPKTVRLIRRKR